MPPRKAAPAQPVPPGNIQLELRAAALGQQTKIMWAQRVHSYTVDQQDDKAVITAVLKPATPKPTVEETPDDGE